LGSELARSYPVVVTPISFSPIALAYAVPKGRNSDLRLVRKTEDRIQIKSYVGELRLFDNQPSYRTA